MNISDLLRSIDDIYRFGHHSVLVDALYTIIELHQSDSEGYCITCQAGVNIPVKVYFPCLTMIALNNELGKQFS